MYVKLFIGLTLLVAISMGIPVSTRVEFKISGSDLPNMDVWNGAPDPFVQVYYAEGKGELYKLMGTTQQLSGTRNPVFQDVFQKNFVLGANQRLRLEVWDKDIESKNDYMGRVDLMLAELANTNTGNSLQNVIQGCLPEKVPCGRIIITRQS